MIKDEARSATAGQDDEPVTVMHYYCYVVAILNRLHVH